MIKADPTLIISCATIVSLGILFALTLFYDISVFRKRKKRKETFYRCESCKKIYLSARRTPLARCPKCQTANPPAPRTDPA
jgi:hypothetical protein